MDDLERVEIRSTEALRAWLAAHHTQTASVWLVTWKKRPGAPYVPYEEIVDEALCWGWIDSRPQKLDDDRTMLLLSPRRAGSGWSRVNQEKVARLDAAGRLQPAGRARIEAAKADGSWSKLDAADALVLPDDLAAALAARPDARARWDRFPPSSRRGILEWITAARTPATRQKRVAETAEKAAVNRKANFPAGRDRGPEG